MEKAELTTGGDWYGRSVVQQRWGEGQGDPQPARRLLSKMKVLGPPIKTALSFLIPPFWVVQLEAARFQKVVGALSHWLTLRSGATLCCF